MCEARSSRSLSTRRVPVCEKQRTVANVTPFRPTLYTALGLIAGWRIYTPQTPQGFGGYVIQTYHSPRSDVNDSSVSTSTVFHERVRMPK